MNAAKRLERHVAAKAARSSVRFARRKAERALEECPPQSGARPCLMAAIDRLNLAENELSGEVVEALTAKEVSG